MSKPMDRSVFRRVRRYMGLPAADRWLLWRAFVALWLVDLRLRFQGFQRVTDDAQRGYMPNGRPVGQGDLARAQTYARWLEVASRHHVVPARCLHRSLALHRWLLREGVPNELRIGVRKERSALEAHAWIEVAGHVINDSPRAIAGFVPLAGSGGQDTPWTAALRTPPSIEIVKRSVLWQ